jgi:nicotinamide-nucleotide amidase
MEPREELESILQRLAEEMRRRGWSVVTAESCTGGGMAAALTDMPGSSAWFDRGWVTYSNTAKMELLDVPADLLERFGAVSGPVAKAMAEGALRHSSAELAVAVTGIAGPGGGTLDKPVGLVWFAWGRRGQSVRTAQQRFSGDRAAVRLAATTWGLAELLREELMHSTLDPRDSGSGYGPPD